MNKLAQIFLRLGLAFTIIYAGVSASANPDAWIGFIPVWLQDIVGGQLVLKFHSVSNIVLGLWLVSGWRTYFAAVITAGFLFAVTVFNLGALDLVFRDVGLFFAAAALAVLNKKLAA